jgi:N-acetylglucosamine-6-phosphate deacetylase
MSSEGYVDLQVNGYAGVDFNVDDLSADALHLACERMRADGVANALATIITEHVPVMCARIARLATLRAADPLVAAMIPAIHVEGPFINESPGYRGAHPADAIRPADLDAAKQLVDAGDGLVRLVTLAPERDADLRVTRWLTGHNVRVAAGHCDPSLDQLTAAIDAGLSLFTHLGNGCPMQLPRHDNIVQRALSLSDRLWHCFIADGVHVPPMALRNYLRCAGVDRCVIVSDAMAAAGLGPGRYRLSRWDVVVGDDLAARAPDGSHLVGAAMSVRQNVAVLTGRLGLTAAQCRVLTVDNPRTAVGL